MCLPRSENAERHHADVEETRSTHQKRLSIPPSPSHQPLFLQLTRTTVAFPNLSLQAPELDLAFYASKQVEMCYSLQLRNIQLQNALHLQSQLQAQQLRQPQQAVHPYPTANLPSQPPAAPVPWPSTSLIDFNSPIPLRPNSAHVRIGPIQRGAPPLPARPINEQPLG